MAMVAALAAGAAAMDPATAQDLSAQGLSAPGVLTDHIPAQDLDSALADFTRQTGIDLLYRSILTRGLVSHEVRQGTPGPAAVATMLGDSGLDFEVLGPRLYVIREAAAGWPGQPAGAPSSRATAGRPDGTARAPAVLPAEIVVAGRRRPELQQEFAGAATLLGYGILEEGRVTGLEGVVARTPNAFVEERTGAEINVFVRGVGTSTGGSARRTDAGIGLFYDGAYSYLQGSRIPILLYDMDRVEVLRGPQGGMYGHNSVGGAVLAFTRLPTTELEAFARVEAGSYDSTRLEGRLNLPLDEQAGLRIVGYHSARDSHYDHLESGRAEHGEETTAGRARLRLEPAPDLDVILGIEHIRESAGPQILVRKDLGTSHISVTEEQGEVSRTTDRLLANLSYRISDNLTLDSLTSFADVESASSSDVSNLLFSAPLGEYFYGFQAVDLDGQQFSQDLVLKTTTGRHLEWLVGVSYFRDRQRRGTDIATGFPSQGILESSATSNSGLEMFAAFTDLKLAVSDTLAVGASLRYSAEERDGRASDAVTVDPDTGEVISGAGYPFEVDYRRLSPGISATWSFARDVVGYALVSTGYQSGGINTRSSAPGLTTFGPSTGINYEAGVKTTWLQQRGSTNVSVFRLEQRDYQVAQLNPPFNEFVNDAEVTTKGLEVELAFRPADALTVRASYGYLDARFSEVGVTTGLGAFAGERLAGAPRHTGSLGATFRHPLPHASLAGFLNVNYWLAHDRATPAGLEEFDNINQVDLRVGVEREGRHGLYLYADNLTDDVHVLINGGIGGSRGISPPRMVGIGVFAEFTGPGSR